MESQITKALTPDLLQVDLTIKNTGSSRSLLEDGIRSVLPLAQNPLHSIAHFHFRRFGRRIGIVGEHPCLACHSFGHIWLPEGCNQGIRPVWSHARGQRIRVVDDPCFRQRWHDHRDYAHYGLTPSFFELWRNFPCDLFPDARSGTERISGIERNLDETVHAEIPCEFYVWLWVLHHSTQCLETPRIAPITDAEETDPIGNPLKTPSPRMT